MKRISLIGMFVLFLCGAAQTVETIVVRSIAQLESLIQKKDLRSVDDLLDVLDPELRSRFLLAFKSRSQMEASFSQPRIILTSPDSKFVLAFTGSSSSRDAGTLEVMHFDDTEKKFKLAQVQFKPGSKAVMERDPESCLGCHASSKITPENMKTLREELHPNWEAYPDWTGFYGTSDHIGMSEAPRSQFISEEFRKFIDRSASAGRYQKLIGLSRATENGLSAFNTDFGSNLLFLHKEKIRHIVESNVMFPEFKASLQSLKSQEDYFVSRLPDRRKESYVNQRDQLVAHVKIAQKTYLESKAKRLMELGLPGSKRILPIGWRKKSIFPNAEHKEYLQDFDSERAVYRARFDFILREMGISPEVLNFTKDRASYSSAQGKGSHLEELWLKHSEVDPIRSVAETSDRSPSDPPYRENRIRACISAKVSSFVNGIKQTVR